MVGASEPPTLSSSPSEAPHNRAAPSPSPPAASRPAKTRDSRRSRADPRAPDRATAPRMPARAPVRSRPERCEGPPRPKAECSGPTPHRRADAPRSIRRRAAALDRGRRSTRRCWPGRTAGRHAARDFAAGIGGFSRLLARAAACSWSPQFERGERLQEERERHDPGITILAAQRQRLGSACPSLDVTPLEVMHVSQTDQRPRPQRSRRVGPAPRAPVRARAFPPRTDRASSRTRTARQRARRPSRQRLKTSGAQSSAARTFSCSIRSRRRHAS